MNFVAIDFETAVGYNSICSVGIITVEKGEIVEEYHQLIQPPNNEYNYYTTMVHGMTSADTANSPTFPEVYPEIKKRISGKTLVAHNEAFDRAVLQKTMALHGLDYCELSLAPRWECTRKLFKKSGFKRCDLATLSSKHNIVLNHHEALSDARACANLYIIHKKMEDELCQQQNNR